MPITKNVYKYLKLNSLRMCSIDLLGRISSMGKFESVLSLTPTQKVKWNQSEKMNNHFPLACLIGLAGILKPQSARIFTQETNRIYSARENTQQCRPFYRTKCLLTDKSKHSACHPSYLLGFPAIIDTSYQKLT